MERASNNSSAPVEAFSIASVLMFLSNGRKVETDNLKDWFARLETKKDLQSHQAINEFKLLFLLTAFEPLKIVFGERMSAFESSFIEPMRRLEAKIRGKKGADHLHHIPLMYSVLKGIPQLDYVGRLAGYLSSNEDSKNISEAKRYLYQYFDCRDADEISSKAAGSSRDYNIGFCWFMNKDKSIIQMIKYGLKEIRSLLKQEKYSEAVEFNCKINDQLNYNIEEIKNQQNRKDAEFDSLWSEKVFYNDVLDSYSSGQVFLAVKDTDLESNILEMRGRLHYSVEHERLLKKILSLLFSKEDRLIFERERQWKVMTDERDADLEVIGPRLTAMLLNLGISIVESHLYLQEQFTEM